MASGQSRTGEGDKASRPPPSPLLARMGMQLFLISLAILFVSSIVAIVIIRNSNPNWGVGAPRIPDLAWLSTGVLLLVSVFSQVGLAAVRRDSIRFFRFCMVLVLILGFLFLFLQEQVWRQMLADVCSLPVVPLMQDEGAGFGAALHALWMLESQKTASASIAEITSEHVVENAEAACIPDNAVARTYHSAYAEYRRAVQHMSSFYSA